MNKKTVLIFSISIFAALVLGVLLGRSFFSSGDHERAGEATPSSDVTLHGPTIWTCSMHPQIQQPEPGNCPICGMDLIPLKSDANADDGLRVMSMSEASRALAEIQKFTYGPWASIFDMSSSLSVRAMREATSTGELLS